MINQNYQPQSSQQQINHSNYLHLNPEIYQQFARLARQQLTSTQSGNLNLNQLTQLGLNLAALQQKPINSNPNPPHNLVRARPHQISSNNRSAGGALTPNSSIWNGASAVPKVIISYLVKSYMTWADRPTRSLSVSLETEMASLPSLAGGAACSFLIRSVALTICKGCLSVSSSCMFLILVGSSLASLITAQLESGRRCM